MCCHFVRVGFGPVQQRNEDPICAVIQFLVWAGKDWKRQNNVRTELNDKEPEAQLFINLTPNLLHRSIKCLYFRATKVIVVTKITCHRFTFLHLFHCFYITWL